MEQTNPVSEGSCVEVKGTVGVSLVLHWGDPSATQTHVHFKNRFNIYDAKSKNITYIHRCTNSDDEDDLNNEVIIVGQDNFGKHRVIATLDEYLVPLVRLNEFGNILPHPNVPARLQPYDEMPSAICYGTGIH